MGLFQSFDPESASADAERALRTPIGAASPLWWAFGLAASAGVAYWWMTRWARPVNLEAGFGAQSPLVQEAAAAYELDPETIVEIEEAEPEPQPSYEAVSEAVREEEKTTQAPEPSPPEVTTAAEATPAAQTSQAVDDLTRMVGIGPKLAAALAERGVSRFSQIAGWSDADLDRIDAELSLKGRARREDWIGQAKYFAGSEA